MKKTSSLISALMTLVLGILCVVLKSSVIGIAVTVLGIVLLVVGILDLVRKSITSGVIKTVLGIAVLLFGHLLTGIAFLVLGVVLLVNGILELVKRIVSLAKRKSKKRLWAAILGFIEPVIWIVGAVFLITNTGTTVAWTIIVAGVIFIVDGVLGLISALASKN